MKICLTLTLALLFALGSALPASARIHAFDASRQDRLLAQLHEVDFEDLDLRHLPPIFRPQLPNPLTLDEVVFADPFLGGGFCSSPTCEPDPDNADGGNNELFLNPGGSISFLSNPKLVVLDIQGIGDNPFTLAVTDARGHKRLVRSQGVVFGKRVIGLFSNHRIAKVELVEVGVGSGSRWNTGGPIALARVLYSQPRR